MIYVELNSMMDKPRIIHELSLVKKDSPKPNGEPNIRLTGMANFIQPMVWVRLR
jgi:hypothetical protein